MKASEENMETLHLFVVPEENLPPKKDLMDIFAPPLCSLFLFVIAALILFSPNSTPVVSFNTTIPGFFLTPVSKTIKVSINATGKGHIDATYARGEITFYNGQTYTQIIPVNTILKGSDGMSVITEAQAIIPPAAETFPPTYGKISIPTHALLRGTNGNILAGDINSPCCVTSVIAQNPYSFTGGTNARDFTYLSKPDISNAIAKLSPTLIAQTLNEFTSQIVLSPKCEISSLVSPKVGSETKTALLTLISRCTAVSYLISTVKSKILSARNRFEALSNIQFSIVGISERKNSVIFRLYVTASYKPVLRLPVR